MKTVFLYVTPNGVYPKWLKKIGKVIRPDKILKNHYPEANIKKALKDIYEQNNKFHEAVNFVEYLVNQQQLGIEIIQEYNKSSRDIVVDSLLLVDNDLEFILGYADNIAVIAYDGNQIMLSYGGQDYHFEKPKTLIKFLKTFKKLTNVWENDSIKEPEGFEEYGESANLKEPSG